MKRAMIVVGFVLASGCMIDGELTKAYEQNRYLDVQQVSSSPPQFVGQWTVAIPMGGLSSMDIRSNGSVVFCSENAHFGQITGKLIFEDGNHVIVDEGGTESTLLNAGMERLQVVSLGGNYRYHKNKTGQRCQQVFADAGS